MVKILKGNRKVRINKGVVLIIKTDNTIEARLIENSEIIDLSLYKCVIFISEEVEK